MIELEKIRFKNFRSYGNTFTEVDLIRNKTTLIQAPNGSGKTSILQGIEFALFGKVGSGINKYDLVNSINAKDCVVEIEFTTNGRQYKVRRGMKPTIFEIIDNGTLINQDSNSRDYQGFLEESILGFNLNSFRQVCSINGGSFTPFMLLNTGARRRMVEELLDLTLFSKMMQAHKRKIDLNTQAIADVEKEIAKLQERAKSLKLGLDKVMVKDQEYRSALEGNVEAAQNKITTLQAEIKTLTQQVEEEFEKLSGREQANKKLEKLQGFKRDINAKLTKTKKFVKFINENTGCPTCEQPIDAQFKAKTIESSSVKEREYSESLQKLGEVITQTETHIKNFESIAQRIKELEREILKKETAVSEGQKAITETQKQLSRSSEDEAQDLKDRIIQTTTSCDKKAEERLTLLEERQYNDLITAVLKDTGIKAAILKRYFPIINKLVNKYLQVLDLNVSFAFDENFQETILSRFRDEFSYHHFSAGERAKIDLALLLTWREIAGMKNSLKCNLLFIDEAFDHHLDQQGLDSFLSLLNEMPGVNVFLISHRPEVSDKLHSTMRIVKHGNFSKIV